MADTDFNTSNANSPADYRVIGRKSWVEYFKVIIFYAIVFTIIFMISQNAGLIVGMILDFTSSFVVDLTSDVVVDLTSDVENKYIYWAYGVFGGFFMYRLAFLRSYKMYLTAEGIWFSYGILPWAKGGNGLRWNDADMAMYYPSFLSWITNSYTLTVQHKYTNSSDFRVTNIWRGRKVVGVVSQVQRLRLGA